MIKDEVVEKLCYIPEDQLLDLPENVLEAVAVYNLMVIGVNLSDGDPRYTEQDLREKYAEFQKIIKSEEN